MEREESRSNWIHKDRMGQIYWTKWQGFIYFAKSDVRRVILKFKFNSSGSCAPTDITFCYIGKREVSQKLHPRLEWRILHILTSEDIDDLIFRFYTVALGKKYSYLILPYTAA